MSYTSEYLKLREERLKKEKKNAAVGIPNDSYSEEYLKLRAKRIKEEKEAKEKDKSEDIAPVKETEADGLFKAGLLDDGMTFKNVAGSILGTVGDVATGVVQGASGLVEGITDLALYGVSGVSDLVGADSFADDVKALAQKNTVNDTFGEFRKNTGLQDASLLGDMGYGVAQGLGQVGAIILTGGAAGAAGAGLGATTAVTTGIMGASSMGSGMSEAYQKNATDGQAIAYGAMKGAVDAGSELIFGGLGKTVKALGLSKGLSSLDDVFAKKLSSKISNQFFKNATELGVKASAEGLEEVLAGLGSATAKKLTYMSDEELGQLIKDEKLLEQFAIGAITSGVAQGGSFVNSVKSGRDFISDLTAQEEAVVNKEVEKRIADEEKDGNELKNKEKNKIYDEVLKDLEKGYISIDTIEETLGGDTYKTYKDKADGESKRESALLKQIESLENLPESQITVKQREDLTKARQQLEELKSDNTTKQYKKHLEEEVFGIIDGSRLAESYNERSRRGQAFEADLSKYDEKQKAVIQKAVDSGILNNTNRTHEFVDMVAKISADKGVLFDFTNNTKLKDSGFAVDGKSVNGFVTKDGVTVNIDSHKSLNSVVGHEITHVLEGTELYAELQNTLFEYAKGKGDYDGRYSTITELYKGVKGADVNSELTADLVGDYLFTDADFINNLSTKNRNVFQKMYDEIKYLCKIATAGSKEARQLEKVKRAFEKAYREGGKSGEDTKYSLTPEQQEYFKDSVVRDEGGNLKVMYHGTSKGGHTVFDTYGSNYGLFGQGSYFTDNKSVAESYTQKGKGDNPQVYETYLNITNPMDMDAEADAEAWRKAFPDADFPESGTNEAFYRAMEEYFRDEEYPKWEAAEEAVGALEGMGYDGITHIGGGRFNKADDTRHRVYIAFNPEQIKNIDNAKPTDSADIRYSLSADSEGTKLTNEQSEYFKDSKMRDDNGNLKVMYHGSPETFTVFDKKKAKSSGTFGKGFYFTDSTSHAATYGKSYEVYLNLTHPLNSRNKSNEITKDQLRNFVEALAENEDYGIDNYGANATVDSVVNDVFGKSDFSMLMDLNISCVGNMVEAIELFNEVNGTEYDGIITPTETVAFYPNQIKNVDNLNPTENPDIRKSLSKEGEKAKQYGKYNVTGEDVKLDTPTNQIAPARTDVTNNVTPTAETAPVTEQAQNIAPAQNPNVYIDNSAPMTEEEAIAYQSERLASLDDSDAPPVMDEPYYGETEAEAPENPFKDRNIEDVGNRKIKAYMYENPEVKPYFQAEAQVMLNELHNSLKGEKWFNDQLYYDTNGEHGWGGTSRHTSSEIAYLLDNYKYTYAQIEEGLRDIIEDHGKENNAVSKRIEFMLHERLADGYTDFMSGYDLPPNQDYINMLNEKQITEYNEEARKQFFDVADNYVPPVADNAPVADIAPSKAAKQPQAYEAIKPKPDNLTDEEAQWAKNKMARADNIKTAPKKQKTAKIYATELETAPKKQRGWSKFVTNFIDKQSVFETLSLKTHNRELMGKANQMLNAESRAQWLIGNGTKGVKSLNSIRQEVEKTGLKEQFYEYIYHKHNVDRMTLSQRYPNTPNKPVLGYDATAEKSLDIVKQYEFAKPEFKAYAQDVYNYMNHLRKQLVDSGVISQETANLWSEMYPHYVPIRRVGDSGLNINVPLDTRKTSVNAPVKRATGGNRDIMDLFDTMAMRTEQTYKAIAKNNFGVELKNTLKTEISKEAEAIKQEIAVNGVLPEGTQVRAHDRENIGVIKSYNQATDKYTVYFENRQGQSATVELDSNILTPLRPPKSATADSIDEAIDTVDNHEELLKKGENGMMPTFTVFDNGKRVEFEITEDMYDALRPKSEGLAYVNPVANTISQVHRGLLTEYNPTFMLTNAIKDAQDVLINSQHPAQTYKKFPKAVSELMHKYGKWYTEYMEYGGEQNTYFDDKTKTFAKDDKGIKKLIGIPLNAISNANNFIERVPRLAEYIASREAGASTEVAMLDAARVTTNFSAGGDVTRFLNRNGATFLNASVQGFNQQVRNIREAKANGLKGWVRLATKFVLAGLPTAILNKLLWEDDEEYEELSDYVKDNYYVVAKYGDGKFVRVPKGRTMAVIQDAFEQMGNLITGNDEVDLANFLDLAVSNLAPNNPIDNNIIAPFMQAASNTTWYGDDLVPARLQDLPSGEQYDESTDAISKWLGEKTGISPYKLNYLLNQYSGGVGDVVLPMLTPEAESGDNSFVGNLIAPLKDKFTTDSVMNNQNVSDFYDTVDELTKNAKSSKATDEDVLKYKYMNSVNAELSDLYARKRKIQNSKFSAKAKYYTVREIQKQIDELTKESLNAYNNVTVSGGYASIGDRHYRVNNDGEWEKITDKQLDKQNDVTKDLGISASEYWNDKAEYDYAYESPGKYAISKVIGDFEEWESYKKAISDFDAKDENGETVSGLKKERVFDYINSLDLDAGQKTLLYRSIYDSEADKAAYNQDIVDYLNSRDDISYEDKVAILEELDITVYDDGTI